VSTSLENALDASSRSAQEVRLAIVETVYFGQKIPSLVKGDQITVALIV
jgi:hypothetical protein